MQIEAEADLGIDKSNPARLNPEQLKTLEIAHVQTQQLANHAVALQGQAVQAAQVLGKVLFSVKATLPTAQDWEAWKTGHLSPDLFDWADQYVHVHQLDLPLDLDAASPATFRSAIMALQIIPIIARGEGESSRQDQPVEMKIARAAGTIQKLFGRQGGHIPKEQKPAYRAMFKELYSWMGRELYGDEA